MKQRTLFAVLITVLAVCPAIWAQTAAQSSPRLPGSAAARGPYLSQRAGVMPQKRTYKRRGKGVPAHKKTFVVTDPMIIAGGNSQLSRKIEAILDYERVFDLKIAEQLKDEWWLDEASYEVNYNNNSILAATLTIAGSSAYPSEHSRALVINLQTGEQVKARDIFIAGKTAELVAEVRKVQQAAVKQALAEVQKDSPDDATTLREMLQGKDFAESDLEHFTVSEKGVTFIYDFSFPHVALALQPDGNFFLPYATLKPYIKRDGLLGRFVR